MKNIDLQVETRDKKELRNKISRKLAQSDYIPAVMYGLKKDPVSVKVKRKEISKLLKGHNISSVIFDIHLEKGAKDILTTLGRLQTDFTKFGEDFNLVGTHLGRAQNSYVSSEKRLSRFRDKLETIEGGTEIPKKITS